MAHIRQHRRSPFWYLRKRTFDGKWTESSTGLRIDDKEETHKAKRLAEKVTMEERTGWTVNRGSDFKSWVPRYLSEHYKLAVPGTRRRMEIAWHTLSIFLQSRRIIVPRQITYRLAQEYMPWRIGRSVNKRPAKHNTARLELKFLSQLMSEAVRMELAESNPLLQMEIPMSPQKKKKALSDAEIAKARQDVKKEAPWMEIVLEIMLYTGCRFNESSIALQRVDFARNNLTMIDSKRGLDDHRRYFTIPLPSGLRSILQSLHDSGAAETVQLSSEKNWRFNKFLKASVGASSHSLRVTFITRCHLSGLNEHQAMRLVNHSTRAVHDIYSRLNVEDVRDAQAQILIPARIA